MILLTEQNNKFGNFGLIGFCTSDSERIHFPDFLRRFLSPRRPRLRRHKPLQLIIPIFRFALYCSWELSSALPVFVATVFWTTPINPPSPSPLQGAAWSLPCSPSYCTIGPRGAETVGSLILYWYTVSETMNSNSLGIGASSDACSYKRNGRSFRSAVRAISPLLLFRSRWHRSANFPPLRTGRSLIRTTVNPEPVLEAEGAQYRVRPMDSCSCDARVTTTRSPA